MSQAESPGIAALDGLRGLACVLILFTHAGHHGWMELVPGLGKIAINSFFTLSGFLMAYHYLPPSVHGMNPKRMPRYWFAFIVRRFFRLYPLFFTLLVAYGLLHMHTDIVYFHPFDWPTIGANLLLLRGDSLFWSVVVEIKFYIFFVLYGCIAMHTSYKIALPVTLWVFMLAINPTMDKVSLFAYMPFFFGGISMAAFYQYGNLDALMSQRAWHFLASFYVLMLALMILGITDVIERCDFCFWREHTRFLGALLPLLLLCVTKSGGATRYIFANPISRFLGLISYSLYMIHLIVFELLLNYTSLPQAIGLWVSMAGAVAAAYLLFRTVEWPARQFGKRLSSQIARD